jgi:hypothetical protein
VSRFIPDYPAAWKQCSDYAKVRISQALEFRAAALGRSLLTAPLPLYYASLSAIRAFISIRYETIPRPSHGLVFDAGTSLLKSGAILRKGTFTEFLSLRGIDWNDGQEITLEEALSHIIELHRDTIDTKTALDRVQVILVNATTNSLSLRFPAYPREFEKTWSADFPSLSQIFEFEHERTLRIKPEYYSNNDAAITAILSLRLLPGLLFGMAPRWFSYRALDQSAKLGRISYYHIALFILGSAVRYQPELVMVANGSESELGWLLRRFIQFADRHFPQLLLWDFYEQPIYFGSNGT